MSFALSAVARASRFPPPPTPQEHLDKGLKLKAIYDYGRAAKEFNQALQLNPIPALRYQLLNELGEAYLNEKENEKAERVFLEVLELIRQKIKNRSISLFLMPSSGKARTKKQSICWF